MIWQQQNRCSLPKTMSNEWNFQVKKRTKNEKLPWVKVLESVSLGHLNKNTKCPLDAHCHSHHRREFMYTYTYTYTCVHTVTQRFLRSSRIQRIFSKAPRIPTELVILGNPGIFSAMAMAMSIYKTLCEKFCKFISQEEVVCLSQESWLKTH